MIRVQVFDASNFPEELYDVLSDYYEPSNDSYHRYYPNRYGGFLKDYQEEILDWLRTDNFVSDSDDKFWYVLIHFSW